MYQPLRIYIGYDPVETEAWHVCAQSIIEHASKPVAIIPLNIRNLSEIYHRGRDPKQSNEFTYTRFLVPYLSGFEGQALFLDSDMILRTDIWDLFQQSDQRYAVNVVKHDYEPKNETKYLGALQYPYPRKNWSSVMLFNCSHPSCRDMTPYRVGTAEPRFLHRFEWLKDSEIGELSPVWNFLVSEYDLDEFEEKYGQVKLVHWTVGGPYFKEYQDVDFADEWFELQAKTRHTTQLKKPVAVKKKASVGKSA